MQLNLLPTVQQAITNLLTVYEPEFLRFGYGLFLSFATILIVWQGIRMMFSHDGLGDQMFEFAKLLMLISFGYALITFYEAPIPGFGVSFSNLITDQAGYFQSVLEARAFDNIYRHFDELADHFMQPDAWSILANLIYWTVLLLDRAREGALAGRHRLRPDRQCRLRSARADLRAVLHRPEARVAVLGLAEVVHPVLVHSRRGDRVPDDLRAVRVPVRDDAPADDHIRGIRRVCPAGGRRDRDVLRRDGPGAVADELDLLGSRRPDHDFVRSADPSAAVARGGDMPRRFSNVPDHLREPHEVEIQGFWNIYFVAIGIVILFGLVSGTLYIAWQLLSARLGQ